MGSENEWIEWHGGGCPVAADAHVQIRFRAWDDEGSWRDLRKNPPALARHFNWSHRGTDSDIIAYRVVRP